ncbi:MAG TPA: malto-oligosyltrehalose trehalohydrolase [Ignavibacteriaceae bacterium]|nr:malto-oligosyltrehalose trehalohydrolase [Ignavibacteriaceae bacterium]
MKIGANYLNNGECEFKVWAPKAKELSLKIISPQEKLFKMEKDEFDYWIVTLNNITAGRRYLYKINKGEERPDPASYFQPDGVHGASEVVDHSLFQWEDSDFTPVELKDYIIYELHTGTFTNKGTFNAIVNKLNYLVDLGITAIEIMPVSQFPGERNWGYDGVFTFAPQNSYGGPAGLKKLVNEAHKKGLSLILDVVYNHLGPEGNYLHEYGPYFTSKYKSLWGNAINFDGPYSDHVRNYFIYNAVYWFLEYHIDALRLDAIETIYDFSAKPFLAELSNEIDEFFKNSVRKRYLIAESDLNDAKVLRTVDNFGFGCDAQWSDDFHHSIHTLLTQESEGYYRDFGKTDDLSDAINNNFVYDGKYSIVRKRKHGNSPLEFPYYRFIHCIQNHDQIGNRAYGERLSELISFEGLKLAAAVLIFTPSLPMLFMGEEFGENNPFLYFVSFLNKDLNKAVKKGRLEEFWGLNRKDELPDPYAEETFLKSKLEWEKLNKNNHKTLHSFYKNIIGMRKTIPAFANYERSNSSSESYGGLKIITMERNNANSEAFALMNFNDKKIATEFRFPQGIWKKILDSSEEKWNGPGASTPNIFDNSTNQITLPWHNFSLYIKETE